MCTHVELKKGAGEFWASAGDGKSGGLLVRKPVQWGPRRCARGDEERVRKQ